jgi:uncharacterized membrane protein
MSTQASEHLLFEAVITPHRSLSRRGRTVLLVALIGLNIAVSTGMWWVGAWPVAGFSGVEIGLAVLLLRLNTQAARACELLLLSPGGLRVIRTNRHGRRSEQSLDPTWLNIKLEERPGRVPKLLLGSRESYHEVASQLGEEQKRDLARALATALHDWRNPRFDNQQLRD